MMQYKINALLYELERLQYRPNDCRYDLHVISKENMPRVEQVIRQFLLDNHDREVGELKAKVYTYEKIIANSNFRAILTEPPKERDGE